MPMLPPPLGAYGGICRMNDGSVLRSSAMRWRQIRLHKSETYLLKSLILSMPVTGLCEMRVTMMGYLNDGLFECALAHLLMPCARPY